MGRLPGWIKGRAGYVFIAIPAAAWGLYVGGCVVLGIRSVSAGKTTTNSSTFHYEAYERALSAYVDGARVNYAGLASNSLDLLNFCSLLGQIGPRTTPELFPTRSDQLAYYINAYNALVLLAVVRHYPIQSVHDVRGVVEPKAGFGFFYALRFQLDRQRVHLYGLEHTVLRRQFRDARIHAAINCASMSCPELAARPYFGGTLDAQLDDATRRFCSSTQHVRIDSLRRTVELSPIFEWFREDFESHVQRMGKGTEVIDFIRHFVSPAVADEIRAALVNHYEVTYSKYDWRLNDIAANSAR